MSTPTLINLPPPPSNPDTPSEMGPGTPNSGTTSLSALSTTAIKDGHQGHSLPHPHAHGGHTHSTSRTTLDAERADRISRLAGLERVATARQGLSTNSAFLPGSSQQAPQPPAGYFDQTGLPARERSTVGSASATGSVGGRTTWASGSDVYDADKMSEGPEDDTVSSGGLSDEGNASLVGFGEGASSTISGPISSRASAAVAGRPYGAEGPARTPVPTGGWAREERMDYVDTDMAGMTPAAQQAIHARNVGATGTETAQRIMSERMAEGGRPMGSPEDGQAGKVLGKFGFEEK
ncbi:MAG: hypothetical protein M1824_004534 [Vezdaea acicularis]|nr:MAG: hypothetical protein M1824_004534 [Vezdaea acicularis]